MYVPAGDTAHMYKYTLYTLIFSSQNSISVYSTPLLTTRLSSDGLDRDGCEPFIIDMQSLEIERGVLN